MRSTWCTRSSSYAAMTATAIVRRALEGSGIELVGSCGIEAYDARAPAELRSPAWVPNARGLIVAASAGPQLWRAFRARLEAKPELLGSRHPYDAFVAELLGRADAALHREGVRFHRFDAGLEAPVRVDFLAMARLVGLGSPGPFALLIHPRHGAWWALRGAWIVDAEVEPPAEERRLCDGCPAPCVGGWENAGGIPRATAEVRSRCVIGQDSRYDEDQIGYHYDRAATLARMLQKRAI
jgi:hypothetical protein